jgi:nitroreductase
MNKRLEFIFRRRSVRKYLKKGVSEKTLSDLLEAAMAAPSACETDPWDFIVAKEQGTRDAMAAILPYGKMLSQAPLGLLVCGDMDKAHSGELSYMLQDCSAAIENLLLAAEKLGLGACWLGVHPRQDRIDSMKKLFSLPESVIPVAAIALGYPAERKTPRTRFKAARVHREKW